MPAFRARGSGSNLRVRGGNVGHGEERGRRSSGRLNGNAHEEVQNSANSLETPEENISLPEPIASPEVSQQAQDDMEIGDESPNEAVAPQQLHVTLALPEDSPQRQNYRHRVPRRYAFQGIELPMSPPESPYSSTSPTYSSSSDTSSESSDTEETETESTISNDSSNKSGSESDSETKNESGSSNSKTEKSNSN